MKMSAALQFTSLYFHDSSIKIMNKCHSKNALLMLRKTSLRFFNICFSSFMQLAAQVTNVLSMETKPKNPERCM